MVGAFWETFQAFEVRDLLAPGAFVVSERTLESFGTIYLNSAV